MKNLLNKNFLFKKSFFKTQNFFFSNPTSELKKTALNSYHKNILKAKMVDFEGFEMPVQYPDGIFKEHLACREHAALFDVSHMGQVRVYGKDRTEFLESLCVSDLKELKETTGVLTLFLNEKGGIIDDSIVTNMGEYFSIVFNAGRKEVDLKNLNNQLNENFKNKDIRIEHLTERSLLAIQGPKASQILQKFVNANLSNLSFMEQAHLEVPTLNETVGVMRCGYTGEDGFEVSVSNKNIEKFVDLIYSPNNSEGILFAGLGARDSLRVEAGLCLYGHDMNEDITPLEASLKWILGKRRRVEGGFKGFKSIEGQISGKTPIEKSRVSFSFAGGPPAREGTIILDKDDKTELGRVTSGTFSPILKQNIGMAYVKKGFGKVGNELKVSLRNKTHSIKIVKSPFVPSKYYKKEK